MAILPSGTCPVLYLFTIRLLVEMDSELTQILGQLSRIEESFFEGQGLSPWLNIKQSAHYLGIGLTKMRELVDTGRISVANIDPESPRRSIRVHRKALDRYLLFGNKRRLNKYERELLDEIQTV